VAEKAGLKLTVADLSGLRPLLSVGCLTSAAEVPDGHYEDDSMRQTVVPNRNMIMMSVAAAHAISCGADAVAYAAHAGDHAIYPDCREVFVRACAAALAVCHYTDIRLLTPFLRMSKRDIVRRGVDASVPFGLTWSCYKGGERHCGKCGTCTERREAFLLAGVPDPTEYEGDPCEESA
jgi:7-cyano-7-deazaguanine synthase